MCDAPGCYDDPTKREKAAEYVDAESHDVCERHALDDREEIESL